MPLEIREEDNDWGATRFVVTGDDDQPLPPLPIETKLTPEQETILRETLYGTDNLCLEAVPGAGKSFILRMAAWAVQRRTPDKRVLMLSFGKAIADSNNAALRELGTTVEAATMHRIGKMMVDHYLLSQGKKPTMMPDKKVRFALDDVTVKSAKYATMKYAVKYRREVVLNYSRKEKIIALIDRARSEGLQGEPALEKIALELGAYKPEDILIADLTMKRCEQMFHLEGKYDFVDMIVKPGELELLPQEDNPAHDLDLILVDEYQDYNDAQRKLLRQLVVSGKTRVIMAGDPHQLIMQFTGASRTVLDTMTTDYHPKKLPLSVSFRCPKKHTALAQRYGSKAIRSAPNAQEGNIEHLDYQDAVKRIQAGDLLYARTVAKLVDFAIMLVSAGKPVSLRGADRDLYAKLTNIMAGLPLFGRGLSALYQYRRSVSEMLVEKKLPARAIAKKMDLFDALEILFKQYHDYTIVMEQIQNLCNPPSGNAVVLLTVHQVKGQEADNAFFISAGEPDLKSDSLEEEMNLHYVAVTRAKKNLYFVTRKQTVVDAPQVTSTEAIKQKVLFELFL